MLLYRQLRLLGHVINMSDGRLPHRVPYGELRLGHRSVGGQKKRFNDYIKSIFKNCNIDNNRLEAPASNRATLRSTCAFDAECDRAAALRRSGRHQHAAVITTLLYTDDAAFPCLSADRLQRCLRIMSETYLRAGPFVDTTKEEIISESAHFRIRFINAHFVADNASHALASSATVIPTFDVEE